MSILNIAHLSDVSATALLTLFCRAHESQTAVPIQRDPEAERLAKVLQSALAQQPDRMSTQLAKGKVDSRLAATITLRARRYDQYAKEFLAKQPDGVVVNLAAGMDTRFARLGRPSISFYDLDLPPMIALKKELVPETKHYHFIASSVLETNWMAELAAREGKRPFLFLAEGLFMYLTAPDVKELVLNLQKHFPGCELVAELFNSFWLRPPLGSLINWSLQKKLALGSGAGFQFGLRHSKEMETWGIGIQFLDDWAFVDDNEPKLGGVNLIRHIDLLRKMQWNVHYRLD